MHEIEWEETPHKFDKEMIDELLNGSMADMFDWLNDIDAMDVSSVGVLEYLTDVLPTYSHYRIITTLNSLRVDDAVVVTRGMEVECIYDVLWSVCAFISLRSGHGITMQQYIHLLMLLLTRLLDFPITDGDMIVNAIVKSQIIFRSPDLYNNWMARKGIEKKLMLLKLDSDSIYYNWKIT